ncbi:MAG: hypothetical protein KF856_16420 [Cyclobacteriaceae bacterium]|nr:hypothetical protein [Cyclobacteriaceae bacterium]
MKKLILIVLIISSIYRLSSAQDITSSTISWEADNATNKDTGAGHSLACTFKSSPESVEWIQKKGELKTTYKIVSIEGTWPDVSQPGSIAFVVERNGNHSKIIFSRAHGQVTVAIDFSRPGQTYAMQEFNIKSVKTSN